MHMRKLYPFFLLFLPFFGFWCNDCVSSPPDLTLKNYHTIYCVNAFGYPVPFTVNSYFFYRLYAYDIRFNTWATFDVYFDYFGNPIEACSGYPIFTNFVNPYAPGVYINLSSFKSVVNLPDVSEETETAPSSNYVQYIQVVGTTNPNLPPFQVLPSLPPGGAVNVSQPISVSSDSVYEDIIALDIDSSVLERDEQNNSRNSPLDIGRSLSANVFRQKIHFRKPSILELKEMKTPFYLFDPVTKSMVLCQNGDDFAANHLK